MNRLAVINNARQLLMRVQLSGNEVPAYIEVMQLLNEVEAECHKTQENPTPTE